MRWDLDGGGDASSLRPAATVRALGLRNACVDGGWSSEPLAGQSWGRMAAVWTTGTVEALGNLGGLVGVPNTSGTIVASYSTAAVECTDTGAAAVVGGLVGDAKAGATVSARYWDTTLSGIADDIDSTPPEGESTVDLQTPTEYGTTGL